MNKNKLFLVLFVFCTLAHLYGTFQNSDLSFYTKPLLIPLLGLWLLAGESAIPKSIFGALIFSWVGDIFLLFDDYFIAGLLAFLVGHVFYIRAFLRASTKSKNSTTYVVTSTIAVVTFLVIFLSKIQSKLGDMTMPVFIYAIVISVMLWIALNRKNKTNPKSFLLTAIGAALFVLSDSLIAWNLFHSSIIYADLLIMSTYLAAQALIVSGLVASRFF